MPKIMKIGWQLTKLLQKLSGLLFLAHPVYRLETVRQWKKERKKREVSDINLVNCRAKLNKSRAIAGRTEWCRCKFRWVSNFVTASRGFSATARLSCIGVDGRPTSVTVQMLKILKLHTVRWFSRPKNHSDSSKSENYTGEKITRRFVSSALCFDGFLVLIVIVFFSFFVLSVFLMNKDVYRYIKIVIID